MEMRIKLGLIAPFPPPSAGMTVLASTLKKNLELYGVEVIQVNTNVPSPSWLNYVGLRRLYQYIAFLIECRRIPKTDIIIVISSSGGYFYTKAIPVLYFCKILNKKIILDFVGGSMLVRLNLFNVFLLRQFRHLYVPTKIFKDIFKEKGIESSVFPHVVDIDRFRVTKLNPESITLLSAKALVKYSCVDDLLRAFKLIKNEFPFAKFMIAGDGPEKQNLENLVTELNLSDVEFYGNIGYDQMPEVFQKSTVLIHGTRFESFGIVLVEAMASGTPIVATKVGGVPNIIDDGINGFLVEHGDYKALADKVINLFRDKSLYNKIVENGINTAAHYGPTVLISDFVAKILLIINYR